WFHLVEDEQDVLRRKVQALAEQSDRFVRNGGGGSCRPPAGDDYLNDHEPIGSVRCVVGEAGIYQKVILVDLEKTVKAVGSVIAGGHLGFLTLPPITGLVGGAEAAPDGEGYKRHLQSPRFRMYQLRRCAECGPRSPCFQEPQNFF